jgi:hypothetical protein
MIENPQTSTKLEATPSVIPRLSRRTHRKLSKNFALSQVLDFGIDEVSQTFEVEASFRP